MKRTILFSLISLIIGAGGTGIFFTKCDRTPYSEEEINYYKKRDSLRAMYYQIQLNDSREKQQDLRKMLDYRDGQIMALTMEKNKLKANIEERNKRLEDMSLDQKRDIFVFYTLPDSGVIVMDITEKQLVKAIRLFYELDYNRGLVRIQQMEIASLKARNATSDALIDELGSEIDLKDLYIIELRDDNGDLVMAIEKRDKKIGKEEKNVKFWRTFAKIGIPVGAVIGYVIGTSL